MKIKVEKWNVDNNIIYKILEMEKCCEKLINSRNICINTEYDENQHYVDDNPEYSVKIIREEENSDPWEDYSYTNHYYEKINFCPFCSAPIIIDIVKELDKNEEYNNLCKERESLWKKCNKTDSKRKEQDLKTQVKELDNKINSMLTSDNFKQGDK